MNTLREFNTFTGSLAGKGPLMPVLFIGHGSPMNGIATNEFTENWRQLGQTIPAPSAVLVISAHWLSRGTRITAMDFPKTLHDFGGFPPELFAVQYPAPGSPQLAQETARIIRSVHVEEDHDWGLDHGAWTVIKQMYPAADIPVLQLSIDYTQPPQYHYNLARELMALRRKGVLILGSGNMVHNLRMVAWEMMNGGGYDWALEINEQFKHFIQKGNHAALIRYDQLGRAARLAIPTPEHYLPLIYIMGLQQQQDTVRLFNDKAIGGSLTMTSVQIG
ncbi:MAG TPA: 4,5-DOPA dioxygenase extradiol [Chitinophaga sp.]